MAASTVASSSSASLLQAAASSVVKINPSAAFSARTVLPSSRCLRLSFGHPNSLINVRSMVATTEEVTLETPKMVESPVAVVTGASRGIGKAVALALGGAGCKKKHIAALPDDQPLVQQSTALSTTFSSQEVFTSQQKRLIVIDGKAVVYRAYFKLMAKLQHGGQMNDTSGDSDWVLTVFTALSTILKTLELTPSHIVVVFDHEGLTFRHTMFADYKLNRSPTPDTVLQSLRYIKPALTAMGVKTVEVPGVEADDVIGTLAVSAMKAEAKVRVLSPDKDFFQLISPSLRLLRFVPRGSGIISFGLEEFQARFGDLDPSQFVDILALTGDRIDNIPGVAGIGEKTAIKLIKLYGTLENLVKERENVKGKLASRGLLADKGEVFLSKRLVTLRTDLPHYMIPFSLDDFFYKQPEDGGQRFLNLIKAMGSFVSGPFVAELEKRTKQLWRKY